MTVDFSELHVSARMSNSATAQVTAQIGGVPTIGLDVPICSVFVALFLALAVAHMTLLQINLRRGHKFIFNGMCFGFAMSRIIACTFRLIWATKPTDVNISLVASVFLNAGILVVYIINIHFAWRMVRSARPSFGWNPTVRLFNKIMLWAVLGLIIPLIVIIILRVKNPTLDHIQTASTVVSRLAQTYFLIIAVEPAVLLALALVKAHEEKDHFGNGSWHGKTLVLGLSTALAITEAGFRCGTTWTPAPLATDPAWWDSKAAFYCFNFAIDVCLLSLFLVGRIDRRFHVPNGSDGPMSYSKGMAPAEELKQEE